MSSVIISASRSRSRSIRSARREQDRAALARGEPRPRAGLEGAPGDRHRAVDVLAVARRDVEERLAGDRAHAREGRARGGVDEGAVDERLTAEPAGVWERAAPGGGGGHAAMMTRQVRSRARIRLVASPAVSSPDSNPHHEQRWLILGVIGIAQLMVVLDSTIVNIALPSAQEDLGFSNDSRQWIVTAYALAFGSLLLLGGRLGDLFGRKWTFIGGLIGFAVASAIGGAAGSFGVLVAARAAPGRVRRPARPVRARRCSSTTFTDPDERGKAFGIFGAIAGGGAAVGLLLGGILTESLSWRWCLYVNLLFAIPTAIAALRLLVNQAAAGPPAHRHPGHADRDAPACSRSSTASRTPRRTRWGHPVTISCSPPRSCCSTRVRRDRAPRRAPAAAAARRHRPHPRRLLPGDRDRRHRDVRRLPVPHLLPAADARASRRSRPGSRSCR